jgi:hypothetical protein
MHYVNDGLSPCFIIKCNWVIAQTPIKFEYFFISVLVSFLSSNDAYDTLLSTVTPI